MSLFLVMSIAYLIGSIPTGYLLAKSRKDIDLRRHGSGNVGATNVLRTVGKFAALLTLIIDIFKGFAVVALLPKVAYNTGINLSYAEFLAILGLCVVIGHNWTIFLKFKGGKGVATSAGVLLGLCPKLLLVGLVVWLLVFALSRIVSLASIIAAISIPIGSWYIEYPNASRFMVAVLGVFILITHRSNINRLLKREEKKVSVKS